MDKIWNIIGKRKKDQSLIEHILTCKGITRPEDRKEFLSIKPQKTYDPFLMKNMKEAVKKIEEHIKKESKIIVYGDYDVDGVTSISLLIEFFSYFISNIDYYIPNRFSEGYGLNKKAISYIKNELKADLMITVDNGINSYDEVKYGKEVGLDIIVTDHHHPPEKIPECIVINPKQKGDSYPFKELCGCGVAFKLAQALQRKLNLPKKVINNALDLVTLATISDLVPLIDENRTIIKYGLKSINANQRLGLAILRKVTGLEDKEIKSGQIGYTLGPCFNAAGRLKDAKIGVQLLLEKNKKKAEKIAQTLYQLNAKRQKIQMDGEKYCKKLVEEKHSQDNFLVLRADDVSEGIVGIIAGKIKDIFYRPTLVVTECKEGYLKGSGRSIQGINIYEEMSKVSDLLLGFGGHEMACGFSIKEENLEELRKRLNIQVQQIKEENPNIFIPKMDIVAEIKAQEFNMDFIKELSKLEPYGIGNPRPLFMIKNIEVNHQWTKACGKEGIHLKFSGKKDEFYLNGIGFSLVEKYQNLKEPSNVDVAFFPDINEYNGIIQAQMRIEDIRNV
ncbi:single-stranded-DNA-specific exonuclease RecJ [Garciella nitratireducens]|uniref:single-stranded-DNA-specific exonuclease RecJ n=1 Tax=Garciella nitratireducens TaxID=218205 RepID=UPI000DE934E1|nr:single-stranded-DNA-specific exonuclease RecJ [Garciella nitratireducens]RBP39538.1 single-stranded-DNA-specific exonuclease RecJ [Garciella nitratireducens]